MQLNHIVVATDLSTTSLDALLPALSLARTNKSKLTLLHVCEEFAAQPHGAPLAPPVQPIDTTETVENATAELERWAKEQGIEATIVVERSNDIAAKVAEFVTEHDADLLALSTHGRTGFRHLVLGSVAESILRHSPVPVLSFPQPKSS